MSWILGTATYGSPSIARVLAARPALGVAASWGVLTHLGRGTKDYQPSNVTWAWLPPLDDRRMKKRERYEAMALRALGELAQWIDRAPLARAA